MSIKLIVGLGNYGENYLHSRHNVGSLYVNKFAEYYQKLLKKKRKIFSYNNIILLKDNKILLSIPNTFMNCSGKSVLSVINFYHILPEEILIVHDELDLLLGVACFKLGGGHNGHKGLKNVILYLNNNSNFYRLRIGIGRPFIKKNTVSFVLEKFLNYELIIINKLIKKAIFCTETLIVKNFEQGVSRFKNYCLY